MGKLASATLGGYFVSILGSYLATAVPTNFPGAAGMGAGLRKILAGLASCYYGPRVIASRQSRVGTALGTRQGPF